MLKNLTIPRLTFIVFRNLETLTAQCLKYCKFGEPSEVLELSEEKVNEPKDSEVVVKVLAAPINPSDINTIQGRYPVKVKFPAIGGNECVGEIISIGPIVKKLKTGDRVIVAQSGLGTWRTIGIYKEDDLMKISSEIGIPEAATLIVNPCTAYRMLKDFVNLNSGDVVIQNGANSGVGQIVHQLCKAWNIQSVGIVRNRTNICELRSYLLSLGATAVVVADDLRSSKLFEKKLPKPKLGLNCVGGPNTTAMTFKLDNKGTLVTYGGMSRKPLTIPTGLIIFNDITFRGFWITRWTNKNFLSPERQSMFDELYKLIKCGSLKAPINELIPLENYKEAIEASLNTSGFTGRKYILEMHKEEVK